MAEIQFNQGYENLTDNQKREFDGVMGMGGFNERYQANPESTLVTSDPDYAAFAPISKAYQESETVNDGFNWGSLIGMGSADASEIPQNNYGLQTQAARPFTMGGITLNADGSLNYNNQSPNLGFRSMVDMAADTENFDNQFNNNFADYNMSGPLRGTNTMRGSVIGPDMSFRDYQSPMGPVKSNMNAPTALDMGKFAGIAGLGVANEPDVEQVAQLGNPSMMRGLRNKIGSEFNKAKDGIMGSKAMNFFRSLPTPTNMLLNMAATRNPLNPRASNYNPTLKGQIGFMKDQGMYGKNPNTGLGQITGGRLTGKNLVSGFGSNDLGKMYGKDLSKLQGYLTTMPQRFSRLMKNNPTSYQNKINNLNKKIAQNKREAEQAQAAREAATAARAMARNPQVYANAGITSGGFASQNYGTNENFSNKTGRGRTGYQEGGLASMFTRRR